MFPHAKASKKKIIAIGSTICERVLYFDIYVKSPHCPHAEYEKLPEGSQSKKKNPIHAGCKISIRY